MCSVSMNRRRRAYRQGRIAYRDRIAANPYDNPVCRRQWEKGMADEASGAAVGKLSPDEWHNAHRPNPPREPGDPGPTKPKSRVKAMPYMPGGPRPRRTRKPERGAWTW